jgi:threonyl-tRNA synthetase
VDERSETLKKKIREAQLDYIPLIITIGDKEKDDKVLSVRTLDGKVKMGVTHKAFLTKVCAHIKDRVLEGIEL